MMFQKGDYILIFEKGKYETKEIETNIDNNKQVDKISLNLIDKSLGDSEIVFVMDISYSMEENDPNDIRKQIISNIISELEDSSKIALVTFAKNANLINDGINKNIDNKIVVTDVFDLVNDDGHTDNSGTNGAAGLTKALSLFKSKQSGKYIVFLTDGEDNKTTEDSLSYPEIIEKAKENNVRIISIGLGDSIDSTNLSNLAS